MSPAIPICAVCCTTVAFVHARRRVAFRTLGGCDREQQFGMGGGVARGRASSAPGWFAAITREIERDGQSDGYWGPIEPKPGDRGRPDARLPNRILPVSSTGGTGLREVPGSNLSSLENASARRRISPRPGCWARGSRRNMLPMQSCFMRGRTLWRAIADDNSIMAGPMPPPARPSCR